MLFRVKAIFEYSSPHEDDLSFPVGQVISVTEEEDDDWYVGEYADASGSIKSGLFPKNFVEKYEPEPPPRPTRPTRQKQAEAPAPQPASEPAPEPPAEEPREEPLVPPASPKPEPEKAAPIPVEPPQSQPEVAAPVPPPAAPAASQAPAPKPAPTQPPAPKPAPAAAAPAPAPAPAPAAKSPPAVAEKPSSFKDRIAAFNKAAAAPIAPFKPGGAPSTFIKKPFVAPPPSRNAYVPPPREAPAAKIYRRDEDPEVAEKVAQDQELAERAGLASSSTQEQGEEDAPKPTSLKERIALLQKQQMEQARRAEASHKEKPKRPPKKRTESHEPPNEDEATPEASARASSDVPRDVPRQPAPRRPSHGQKPSEVLSDANDADQSAAGETTEDAEGTSTSVEEDEERKARTAPKPAAAPSQEQAAEAVEEEEGSEEEEDEIDEETRRRMELRERMAKMSGGMGMAGMFGGFPMGGGAAPPKKKKAPPAPERKATDDSLSSPPPARIAMVPVPGMAPVRSPEPEDKQLEEPQAVSPATVQPDDVEPRSPPQSSHGLATQQSPTEQETSGAGERSPPPVPSERPVPVPLEARPVPAPPAPIQSPSAGSESDDEMPGNARERPVHDPAPPVPPLASRPDHAGPIQSPPAVPKRTSYIGSSPTSPETPNAPTSQERRSSRVPPIPGTIPPMSPPLQSRPPPPPPPTSGPPSRQPTFENPPRRSIAGDDDEGETEYEGDYDTDIAPGATHKDALKAHAREASLDGSTTADEAPVRSPVLPPAGPPPIPTSSAPRAVPPPLPSQPPPHRQSMDAPRAPPPPVPPPKEATVTEDQDDEYDPYKYTASPPRAVPPVPKASAPMNVPPSSPPAAPPSLPPSAPPAAPPRIPPPSFHPQEYQEASDDDELYASPPPRKSVDRAPPPPPAQHPPLPERHLPPPPPPQGPPPSATARKSLDISRISTSLNRRSMDQPRASTDTGFIANDVDLGYNSQWWAQPNTPPPVFQNRKDVQIEFGEPPANPGEYYKQVYVLFQDYSQTIITAQFDPRNPREANLEQRHEPPPPRPRPDQLEAAYSRYGAAIASAVASKQNAVIDDGTPHGLVLSLLRGVPGALLPVGTRSYGALVYANIANATVKSDDEIRPGDIISFRNARFQGKHGAMHAKYSMDVGKPDHVGIVMDWDGTKKKIRAYDQGRESKKVKVESFRVGDLRSGEVRVWRVMGKSWVGWPDDA